MTDNNSVNFTKYIGVNTREGIALRPMNPFDNASADLETVKAWTGFQRWAEEQSTLLCHGVVVGGIYERAEVEVIWQYQMKNLHWYVVPPPIFNSYEESIPKYTQAGIPTRQIFRLITQPVEKESECDHHRVIYIGAGRCRCRDCNEDFIHAEWEQRQEKEPELVMPPLGVMPQWLWNQKRVRLILEAIERYEAAEYSIPNEWYEELQQLSGSLKPTISLQDKLSACFDKP